METVAEEVKTLLRKATEGRREVKRMIDAKAFAHAAAVVAAALYLICWVFIALAPDVIFGYFTLIAHGVSLEAIRSQGEISVVNGVIGLALWAASAWATFYAFGYVYNGLKK